MHQGSKATQPKQRCRSKTWKGLSSPINLWCNRLEGAIQPKQNLQKEDLKGAIQPKQNCKKEDLKGLSSPNKGARLEGAIQPNGKWDVEGLSSPLHVCQLDKLNTKPMETYAGNPASTQPF